MEIEMEPRNKRTTQEDQTEAPAIEQQDWDAVEGAKIAPDSVAAEGGGDDATEADGTLPDEDDDNAYQNSDEALPDDDEERVLSRDPSKEGSRFDEV
ncbi:hypothetical protein CN311_07625 [Mesorhizobium sanjuanii]|uniref:Uncharacterized protein n=1 Tax=Mesorhizobium sanjuanii TaxID=2037900 RepID=A0A2A6FI92_9HYPH|nr:hypothetical protein [Mesorhizobium sanjuanii]PDQ21689.1 hypothetical protein CN311_07625 [Mesorhizobium sanjuanii]